MDFCPRCGWSEADAKQAPESPLPPYEINHATAHGIVVLNEQQKNYYSVQKRTCRVNAKGDRQHCGMPVTHLVVWHMEPSGRVRCDKRAHDRRWPVCEEHAQRFALKHGLNFGNATESETAADAQTAQLAETK